MLGHIVGSVVQVVIQTSCDIATNNNYSIACRGIAVFTHEMIVEPLVDAMLISCLQGRHHSHLTLEYKKIIVSALFSLLTGQIAHSYLELGESKHITELEKNPICLDGEENNFLHALPHAIVDSITSLGGGLLGNKLYDCYLEKYL